MYIIIFRNYPKIFFQKKTKQYCKIVAKNNKNTLSKKNNKNTIIRLQKFTTKHKIVKIWKI